MSAAGERRILRMVHSGLWAEFSIVIRLFCRPARAWIWPDRMMWRMPAYAWTKTTAVPEENRQFVLDFIARVDELGLDLDGIGYQYPAMDQDITLRKILRTDKTSGITSEQAGALYSAQTGEKISGATVKFTDF